MRTLKVISVLAVTVFIMGVAGMSFAAPPGEWPAKRGSICLTVWASYDEQSDEYDDYLGQVNMYVIHMGDDNSLVTGCNTEVDEQGDVKEISPFIGAAEIIETDDGPKVKIHVTSSGAQFDDVHGNMTTVILDPVTLEGELETLDLNALKDGSEYNVSYAGKSYLQPCEP